MATTLTNNEVVSWLGLDRASVRAGVDAGLTWRQVAELCRHAAEHAEQLADDEAAWAARRERFGACILPCPSGTDYCAAHGCELAPAPLGPLADLPGWDGPTDPTGIDCWERHEGIEA